MTATAVTRNTPMMAILGLAFATMAIGLKAAEVVPEGVLVGLDTSGRIVNAIGTDPTIKILGRSEESKTGGSVDLDTLLKVKAGCFRWENGDTITDADIGKAAYAADNQTIAKGDNGGARPYAGVIVDVDSAGVWVATIGLLDSTQALKNEIGGAQRVQGGTGTLVAGVLTVSTGVQLTAASRIVVCRKTPAGTFSDGGFDAPAADRTVGEVGVASFVIRARAQDGTANTADTSTVDYIIFG